MAPITIVLRYAPSDSTQRSAQKRLRLRVREARNGVALPKPVRLQHDDMIDLTGEGRRRCQEAMTSP